MLLKHFFIPKIAHSSYMLCGGSVCAVIDPARNADMYIRSAEEAGLRITHVLQTHLHADFLSGHIDIAGRTGAEIVVSKSARCTFPCKTVSGGDTLMIEDMRIDVMETPGHTPEHVSYVVTDTSRGDDPVGIFCGDTLFVGDAGRPDLFPGRAEELASDLYDSLKRIMKLPDFCEVYPAHGAGSLCGRAVGAKYRSTVGYERRFNPVLQIESREDLVESLTSNMPLVPDHFRRCSDINRRGPVPISGSFSLKSKTPEEFYAMSSAPDTTVVDVRSCDCFASQHIPESLNISTVGNFPTFAGWILNPSHRILLVANSRMHAIEAADAAAMVCENKIAGYLSPGLFGWAMKGLPLRGFGQMFPNELAKLIRDGESIVLVDVRGPGEYSGGTIEGAVNIPAPDLRTRYSELDISSNIILFCSSGHRSSLAASILERKGFRNLAHLSGGLAGWSRAVD